MCAGFCCEVGSANCAAYFAAKPCTQDEIAAVLSNCCDLGCAKCAGDFAAKLKKALTNYLFNGPPRAQQFFEAPAPTLPREKKIKSFEVPAPGNFPYTICKSRKLKSWPCLQFFLTQFAIMKEKKSLPQQICHRKRNDWNFCPGNFRKICLKATTCGQNVMFDVSFSFKTSKVWLCFACCLPFKNMCFHNPAPGVLLIKKCRWKNIVVCPCNFFLAEFAIIERIVGSPCSGLLLTRFANEKNEFLAQEILWQICHWTKNVF